jgi:hypothetical protein
MCVDLQLNVTSLHAKDSCQMPFLFTVDCVQYGDFELYVWTTDSL